MALAGFARCDDCRAQYHRLVLENDRVRVLDTVIPVGEIVPVHTHRWPAVYYTIAAGDFIRRDGDGNVLFDSRTVPGMLTSFCRQLASNAFRRTRWRTSRRPRFISSASSSKTEREF